MVGAGLGLLIVFTSILLAGLSRFLFGVSLDAVKLALASAGIGILIVLEAVLLAGLSRFLLRGVNP